MGDTITFDPDAMTVWLIPSRDPERLAACLERARGGLLALDAHADEVQVVRAVADLLG